ncbi:hypothetical protein PVAND_012959 [Polypedilum vanderplanki]|uniref:Alkaline phosphatase n=1 Tax=Polypedilum vanderplanki TaxID=319348 RepID=A0A9J6CNZ3_POLVA|nr:hypothetical protein PVAND_012959 [Polypedilum vanderplanki]
MKTLKFFTFSVFFIAISKGEDDFHPKPLIEIAPHIELNDVDSRLRDLEGFNEYWNNKAQNYIADQLKSNLNTKKAKNLILFLGDGLSISTVAATRMYLGGEEVELDFEKFSHYGLAKTYCVDRQVSDSACTATAFLSGVKNNYRSLGLTANVLSNQCNFNDSDITYSMLKWAQDAGKATGIVTTTRITHATPAGAYAHSPHREWENNAAISSTCRNSNTSRIVDIAHQLIYNEEAQKFKVILGGGTRHFLNTTMQNEEGRAGERTDGRNLIDEWLQERNKIGKAKYFWHKQQLDELNVDDTDYLLGLFEHDHLMYRLDVVNARLQAQEPMLTDLTRAAIKMLKKEDNGFVLLVEGGRIDHAHHSNYARKSLDETAEFARAIELAKLMTNEEETLIVVTSDHSHVFTYAGYPLRKNDVLRTAGRGDDRMPYETLSYANGPGYDRTFDENGVRANMTEDDFSFRSRRYSAMVSLSSETHAGEDVGVYANGPWSHLFQGSYEQNVIPIAMAYAAKIGPYADIILESTTTQSMANGIYIMPVLLIFGLILSVFKILL